MNIIELDCIDSTNKYLKNNYLKLDDLTFVNAFEQTCGRGREDRTWLSSKGQNLTFSILIKNNDLISSYQYLSLLTAYSIIKSIEHYGIKNAFIKWPNDIYINDKKVCGILLEGSLPTYLIVGIGLNINQTAFPGQYRALPTSLKNELHKDIDLECIKKDIFNNLLQDYKNIDNHLFLNDILKYDYLANKKCFVSNYDQNKEVEVIGIQDDASLLIKDEDRLIKITSGEVYKL